MPRYNVDFNVRHYNGSIEVEAESEDEAATQVENMQIKDLLASTHDIEVDVECVSFDASEAEEEEGSLSVEYDLDYRGGDYGGVGTFVYLSAKGVTDETVASAFQRETGIDPVHIVSYAFLDDSEDE